MAIPLNYQISEFDCGPVSLLNALNHQFDRRLIKPCIIKTIYSYSLDCCDNHSHPGYKGTSAAALRFMGEWMNEYGVKCGFPVYCESLSPGDIWLGEGSPLNAALDRGAVAVTRCLLEVGHYVLITGAQDGWCQLWDPYYLEKPIRKSTIRMVADQPAHCNRMVAYSQMNAAGKGYYNLGDVEKRECLLVFNTARSGEVNR